MGSAKGTATLADIDTTEKATMEAKSALNRFLQAKHNVILSRAGSDTDEVNSLRKTLEEKTTALEQSLRQLEQKSPPSENADLHVMALATAENHVRAIREATRKSPPLPPLTPTDPPSPSKEDAASMIAALSGTPPMEPTVPPCAEPPSLDNDHQKKWNPGCRPLADGPIGEEKLEALFDQCLASLLKVISSEELDSDNRNAIARRHIFANMRNEKKINPVEQRFLAMVLTSFGETRGQLDRYRGRDKKAQEERMRYQRIMRVIDNRTRHYARKAPTVTPMDTVLVPKQFSIYNPGGPNLPKMLHYGDNSPRRRSMKNAVLAYIRYENNGRKVPEIPDDTYHFVAHWLRAKNRDQPHKWYNAPPLEPPFDIHHAFLRIPGGFPEPRIPSEVASIRFRLFPIARQLHFAKL